MSLKSIVVSSLLLPPNVLALQITDHLTYLEWAEETSKEGNRLRLATGTVDVGEEIEQGLYGATCTTATSTLATPMATVVHIGGVV
jgi:hypothetical protein